MTRKPLTTAQLGRALEVRIAKVKQSVEAFRNGTNPQVRELFLSAAAELGALELVRDAIQQRSTYFLEH